MKVVFIIPDSDHYRNFFSDINENESILVLGKPFSVLKRVEKKLYHNKKTPDWIYKAAYIFLNSTVDFECKNNIAFTDLALKKLPNGFVRWLKTRYPESKFILLFYNKLSTLYNLDGNLDLDVLPDKDLMQSFDKIYSYDIDEAARLGFEFYVVLSNVRKSLGNDVEADKHDVFYCGSVGAEWKMGRYNEVDKIYNFLISNGIDCDFHLVFGQKLAMPDCSYASKTRIPYLDMIRRTIGSKVILDIISDNKSGISARFYDALMYNKKYLTNNQTIKKHPYYDPKYMHVYESLDDIDLDWLRSDELVDYHYDGYFTPNGFYQKMNKENISASTAGD